MTTSPSCTLPSRIERVLPPRIGIPCVHPLLLMTPRPTLRTPQVELRPAQATTERFELYKRYQIAVHGDAEDSLSRGGFARFLCENGLGVGRSVVSQPRGSADGAGRQKQRIPYPEGKESPPGLPKHYGCFHQRELLPISLPELS